MHLAQVNVARLTAPIDDPRIREFVDGLAPVNALADAAPGFVWRMQDDSGDATHIEVDPDPLMIMNLSVWEDVAALMAFVRSPDHAAYLRRRREWFQRWTDGPYVCLWWVEEGHRPTPAEALERLAHLRAVGPSPQAFTTSKVFEPA